MEFTEPKMQRTDSQVGESKELKGRDGPLNDVIHKECVYQYNKGIDDV